MSELRVTSITDEQGTGSPEFPNGIAVDSITDSNNENKAAINGFIPSESNMAGRNRIINGDMRIAQRGTGPFTANGSYPADRFRGDNNASSVTFSVQQVEDAPPGFTNSILWTTTAGATPDTNQSSSIHQYIEGNNIADLGWGTTNAQNVTLSFWVRSSLTGIFSGTLQNAFDDRAYGYTYQILSADTWEYKTITILGDTTGTWNTNNTLGIRVFFGLGAGSDRVVPSAGSWFSTSGGVRQVSGTVSINEITGATWQITGVQLEAGSVATPFERRPYGTELALCQRYFCKTYNNEIVPGTAITAGAVASIAYGTINFASPGTWMFPVTMRTTPTVIIFSTNTGETGQVSADSADGNGIVGFTSDSSTLIFRDNNSNGVTPSTVIRAQATASAEL